jgi:threonine dehydrogenase-like Zn-dependent dehydrogenase
MTATGHVAWCSTRCGRRQPPARTPPRPRQTIKRELIRQFAILSAHLQGAGRVIAVDGLADRLAMAKAQHAEVVDFNSEDQVQAILDLTGGIGVDRAIDAVGVDAERPGDGPAAAKTDEQAEEFHRERDAVAPDTDPAWAPGDAPTLAARWAVETVAKAGTIGVVLLHHDHDTSDRLPTGLPAACRLIRTEIARPQRSAVRSCPGSVLVCR